MYILDKFREIMKNNFSKSLATVVLPVPGFPEKIKCVDRSGIFFPC
jgi:hypothetical protein